MIQTETMTHLHAATVAELSAAMAEGRLTSAELTAYYLERIAVVD
jgi:Asp-tRNA(Asn)/Glu-tRNA(Gln) amidotransferase A subunit family amidase